MDRRIRNLEKAGANVDCSLWNPYSLKYFISDIQNLYPKV